MLRSVPRIPVVIGITLPVPCGHKMLCRKRVKARMEERVKNIIRNCKKMWLLSNFFFFILIPKTFNI
jgi:hypothetical protein